MLETTMDKSSLQTQITSALLLQIKQSLARKTPEEEKALTLPYQQWQTLGCFLDEAHFFNAFHLLVGATQEVPLIQSRLKKMLANCDDPKESVLDVGSGDGTIIEPIANQFKHITLLDKCPEALNQASLRLQHTSATLTLLYEELDHCMVIDKKYDLIIASQIIYYVEKKNRVNFLTHLIQRLNPGGELFFSFSAGLEKTALIHYFNGEIIGLDEFLTDCKIAINSNAAMYCLESETITDAAAFHCKDSAVMVSGFYLKDGKVSANKAEVEKQMNAFQIHTDLGYDAYKITFHLYFVIIKRKKS